MNLTPLLEAFNGWRRDRRPVAMATVVRTKGSSYTKAGAFMLFGDPGYAGLLSGGCLEPDLAEHARSVLASNTATLVTYDMRDRDADELWGLGLGCNGMMQVLLQPLCAADDYQPFATIADAARRHTPGTLVMSCDNATLGQSAFVTESAVMDLGLGPALSGQVAGIARASEGVHRGKVCIDREQHELLYVPLQLPLRLLLLGAGPDAIAVLEMALQMGWRVTVADHRDSYLQRPGFAAARRQQVDPRALHDTLLREARFDAAVVMSHHFETDCHYLAALAQSDIRYIGLLGPPDRKSRAIEAVGGDQELMARVHGPVGLDIGARGPEGIALSIIAGIYAETARVRG